jgi:hypothetical protein
MMGIGVLWSLARIFRQSGCFDELASLMKRELSQARNGKGFELTKVPVEEN